mmetsp:Transcript_9885/g.24877  ORF Transcript_9885/g.24877 Transcript_9885/m.24877 type:complete len:225 (+) Transcript_9885:1332-2006(+)
MPGKEIESTLISPRSSSCWTASSCATLSAVLRCPPQSASTPSRASIPAMAFSKSRAMTKTWPSRTRPISRLFSSENDGPLATSPMTILSIAVIPAPGNLSSRFDAFPSSTTSSTPPVSLFSLAFASATASSVISGNGIPALSSTPLVPVDADAIHFPAIDAASFAAFAWTKPEPTAGSSARPRLGPSARRRPAVRPASISRWRMEGRSSKAMEAGRPLGRRVDM